jgi:hypothetical protein
MGGGRRDHRPAADRGSQGLKLGRIGRRRRHVELEIAGGDDMRRAQFVQAFGVGRRASKTEIEPPQQVDDRVRQISPVPQGAFRQPAIDQDQRHAALRCLDHHVRPQIGFHEQREVRVPMIEEAAHEARHVERHELMNDAARQPLLGKPAGCDGAGSDQHADFALRDALDQGQDARQFADTGAMQPDQRARRPSDAGLPAPLGQPHAMLLAVLEPLRQQQRRQWRHRRRQQPIGAQRGRQRLTHGCWLPLPSAIS